MTCKRQIVLGMVAPIFAGGCAEMTTSIYHSRPLSSNGAITVDAYQRSTYVTRVPTDPAGQLRLCAEAAPDTFSALSASLAAEGDVVKKSASLAAAISQSGATIERTQTVNLLRESLYRTCERYLSGATSRETLVVQAARDQRAMVAVLAIEQLTRAARPSSTVLSAGPTSATVPDDRMIEMIDGFRKERDAAAAAAKTAEADFDKANVAGECKTVAAAPADDTGKPKKSDWEACDKARAIKTARDADVTATTQRLDKGLALTGGVGGAIGAGTQQGPNNAGGGGGTPSDASVIAVAGAIENIVLRPAIDEALMFCIGLLSSDVPAERRDPAVRELCLAVVQARALNDENARAYGFGVQTQGVDLLAKPFGLGVRGDTAGPVLKQYLLGVADEGERKRRMALVQQAAAQIGVAPPDVTGLIFGGDPERKAALLDRLRGLETDPTGKAALGAN